MPHKYKIGVRIKVPAIVEMILYRAFLINFLKRLAHYLIKVAHCLIKVAHCLVSVAHSLVKVT